jgi:hypothetical protein
MNQVPDVGVVLDILHKRKGTCGAHWFVPERWNHAAYADGTTDLGRPGELRVDPCDFFAACIEKALREGGAALEQPARCKPLTESIAFSKCQSRARNSSMVMQQVYCGTACSQLLSWHDAVVPATTETRTPRNPLTVGDFVKSLY